MYEFYVDLDGVLVDLNSGLMKECPEIFKLHKTDKDAAHKIIENLPSTFWSELHWTSDGEELWNYLKPYDKTILSAHMQNPVSCRIGKKLWIRENLGLHYMAHAIICFREYKKRYSGKNKILIDDSYINIEEWNKFGGIGVLHKNTIDTIEKIEEIMKNGI